MFFKVLNPIINFISIKLSYCFKEIIIYKMELNISPLDNRYKNKCEPLREYVSDFGFNKIR